MSSAIRDTLTITRKELLVFIKQPLLGITRSIIFPLVWIIFFAYGFGGTLHSIPIAIANDANGVYSQSIVNNLATGNTFSIQFLPYRNALQAFQDGKVFAVVYLPPDFNTNINAGDAKVYVSLDETNPTIYATIKASVEAAAHQVSARITTVQNVVQSSQVTVDEEVYYGAETRYLDFLAPGLVIQTIVFSAMFSGGISLIIDREFGTLKMLMMAPISRTSIIMGKTISGVVESLISGLVTLFIIILLGAKVEYTIGLALVAPLIMILISFAFIGLSTFIATRVKDIVQFTLVLQILIQPLWFVSGAIYPIYSMPDWMQAFASVNPMRYASDAMRSVMIRSGALMPVIGDLMVLLAFAVIISFIGIRSFRRTIE
jgi:ABC-2 type transport system permease protein